MDLINYIDDKKQLEVDGYKFFYIFEVNYLEANRELYSKKVIALEKLLADEWDDPKKINDLIRCGYVKNKFEVPLTGTKIIHIGSEKGFLQCETIFLGEEKTDDANKVKSQRFVESFKKIIAKVPNKSCLLLNSEQILMMKLGRKNLVDHKTNVNNSVKMMLREKAAQAKGQKMMTSFFSSVKGSSPITPVKKSAAVSENGLAELIQKLRGDEVKYLTVPKTFYDLDSSRYVAIFFLNEASNRQADENYGSIGELCEVTMDTLPSGIWKQAVDFSKKCETLYAANYGTEPDQNEEDGENDTVTTDDNKRETENEENSGVAG